MNMILSNVTLWIPNGFLKTGFYFALKHPKILLNENIARDNFMVYPVCVMLANSPGVNFFTTSPVADFASLQNRRVYPRIGFQNHQRYTSISIPLGRSY